MSGNILRSFNFRSAEPVNGPGSKAAILNNDETPVLVVAIISNFQISPKTVLQNGDRTWERCAASGDSVQAVSHGQPARHEYSYHRKGSDSFLALDTYGREF